jgi:hypothetical protein
VRYIFHAFSTYKECYKELIIENLTVKVYCMDFACLLKEQWWHVA